MEHPAKLDGKGTYAYVCDLLVKQFDVPAEEIRPDATLAEDLGVDSIDAVDIIVHMREVVGERITPERFKNVRTVQELVDIVDSVIA